MAPNPPRAADLEARRAADKASLIRVQRRIGAIAFSTVTIHAVIGVIVAAHIREGQGRHADAVGLLVMSCVIAAVIYVVTRVILGATLWSPAWMLLAAALPVAGFVWVL